VNEKLPQGNADAVNNQAAYDEACRELRLRGMMYPKWVRELRLSRTDARRQLDAQARIVELLGGLPDVTVNVENPVDSDEVPF